MPGVKARPRGLQNGPPQGSNRMHLGLESEHVVDLKHFPQRCDGCVWQEMRNTVKEVPEGAGTENTGNIIPTKLLYLLIFFESLRILQIQLAVPQIPATVYHVLVSISTVCLALLPYCIVLELIRFS